MADVKKPRTLDIPFIVDGAVRVIKRVSKHTTCNDVIAKLPNLDVPLAVFLAVDGIEKELPGKTKLLKSWRANGSSAKVEFVIRKSETLSTKATKKSSWLFGDRKGKSTKQALSKESLKQVSDLAFYVRYQKMKINEYGRKHAKSSDVKTRTQNAGPQQTLMRKMTSHASTNSMDAFLAKADLDEMARFLNFCGKVTEEKLAHGETTDEQPVNSTSDLIDPDVDDLDPTLESLDRSSRLESALNGFKVLKLGLKQKFSTKPKMATRTTSTGTIESTDTGYGSVDQESQRRDSTTSLEQPTKSCEISKTQRTRPYTLLLEDIDGAPRHSTPVGISRPRKRRANATDRTLTQEKLDFLDDRTGKDTILEKFMADQTMPTQRTGSQESLFQPEAKRQCLERQSMPAFRSQQDHCRFLWNKYSCDSDSDSESEVSEQEDLDVAFMETSEPRRMRRESAISNLNRFSLTNLTDRFSLANNAPRLCETREFDYSFDCSFPRMDESQSFDFSFGFQDNDIDSSDSAVTGLDEKTRSPDESMASFMNTKMSADFSFNSTVCDTNMLEKNITLSDEGIGSVTSASWQSEVEVLV